MTGEYDVVTPAGRQALGASPPGQAPARLLIDLDAIAANTAVLREHAGGAALMAVVKADGYGHGLVPSARAARRGGADWLGTALLGEALDLRRAGLDGPLLSWLHAPGAPFGEAIDADIDLGVSAPWALEEVAAAARERGRPARVHLKVDTGLGRNGAYGPDVPDVLARAARLQREGALRVVGLMSHFAYADAPGHPTVRAQRQEFERYARDCAASGLEVEVRHLANSAATLTDPACAFDMVRPGLALYGLSPVPQVASPEEFGLRPAMTCVADLALVKGVPAGQGLSYGHDYAPAEPTRVGVVPCGYADGVPRAAGNRGPVLVGGERRTVSGRVCMDQFVVDLGPSSRAQAGDSVILFGDPRTGAPSAQDWADAADTISYEIITRMSSRLPRVPVTKEAA